MRWKRLSRQRTPLWAMEEREGDRWVAGLLINHDSVTLRVTVLWYQYECFWTFLSCDPHCFLATRGTQISRRRAFDSCCRTGDQCKFFSLILSLLATSISPRRSESGQGLICGILCYFTVFGSYRPKRLHYSAKKRGLHFFIVPMGLKDALIISAGAVSCDGAEPRTQIHARSTDPLRQCGFLPVLQCMDMAIGIFEYGNCKYSMNARAWAYRSAKGRY
jgi:hypothetical protein